MADQPQIFKSNGKLLLTGEYLVLRGALALALPTRMGQSLEISALDGSGHPHITWFAMAPQKQWFKTSFELPSMDIIGTDDRLKASKLQLILLTLQQLKPELFDGKTSYKIITRLDFEPEWGLGSSSTLIANLAKWSKSDPYTLLNFSIGGSGYDIACATAESSIFYKKEDMKPVVQKAFFKPSFDDQLFFVYQGQKKDTDNSIRSFNQFTKNANLDAVIEEISEISMQVAVVEHFESFCELMKKHEAIIAELLQQDPIQTSYPDFNGQLKSLGAWGGDFMLAMTTDSEANVKAYFASKGLDTIFSYSDLIK